MAPLSGCHRRRCLHTLNRGVGPSLCHLLSKGSTAFGPNFRRGERIGQKVGGESCGGLDVLKPENQTVDYLLEVTGKAMRSALDSSRREGRADGII